MLFLGAGGWGRPGCLQCAVRSYCWGTLWPQSSSGFKSRLGLRPLCCLSHPRTAASFSLTPFLQAKHCSSPRRAGSASPCLLRCPPPTSLGAPECHPPSLHALAVVPGSAFPASPVTVRAEGPSANTRWLRQASRGPGELTYFSILQPAMRRHRRQLCVSSQAAALARTPQLRVWRWCQEPVLWLFSTINR